VTDGSGHWEALTPAQVAATLGSFDGPWWIAGGVAIDLFLGTDSRPHDDIDVAVLRDHWPSVVAALPGWEFREGEHEVWGRQHPGGPWNVEFLLEERSGQEWVYRRHPDVTVPITEVGMMTAEGIPYERPEIVLLSKAENAETDAKHEADLAAALPKMGVGPRCWLAGALDVAHPGHPWIARVL
jgi:hypothetical protein